MFRNPANAQACATPPTLRGNNRILEFPTSPVLVGRKFCTSQSDGNRRDNSPNARSARSTGALPMPSPRAARSRAWTRSSTFRAHACRCASRRRAPFIRGGAPGRGARRWRRREQTSSRVSAMIRSISCRLIACISRNPRPRCAPNISPSSVPISVSEKPTRIPVTISGSAARQQDLSGRLHRREPQHARGAQVHRRDVADCVHREERDRHDAVDRAEGHFRRHADAEYEQDHRVERHLGNRVERDQDRLGHLARQAARAERQADEQADRERNGERLRKATQRLADMRRGSARPPALPPASSSYATADSAPTSPTKKCRSCQPASRSAISSSGSRHLMRCGGVRAGAAPTDGATC